ncbi:MAG: hypothetical protein AB8B58_11645 [Roseobacter sp.]
MRLPLLDALWLLSLVLWAGLSVWAYSAANADSLPRFGALLVTFAVVYYALVPIVIVYPNDVARVFHQHTVRINDTSAALKVSFRNTSVLAASVAEAMRKSGWAVPKSIKILAEPVKKELHSAEGDVDWDALNARSEKVTEAIVAASNSVVQHEKSKMRWQALFAAVGTLQWGFGDLLL